MDEIQGLYCRFCCGQDRPRCRSRTSFYSEEADYYDSGLVTKDFIRKDILRYDRKWPVRRYWLNGDIRCRNGLEADTIEVQYQSSLLVKKPRKESGGSAIKTLKLRKTRERFRNNLGA